MGAIEASNEEEAAERPAGRRLAAGRRREGILGGIDEIPDPILAQIARLAARTFDAPIAFLCFAEAGRLRFRGCLGWPHDALACHATAGAELFQADTPLCVADARADPELRDAAFVGGAPHVGFYAGAPIQASDGTMLGTICVADTEARPPATAERMAALAEIARLAALAIGYADTARARLTDFAETSSDWLWETDSEHRFSRFIQLHGIFATTPMSSFIGKRRWELAGAGPLDDRWLRHIADLEARRPFRNFEYTTDDADGLGHRLRVSGKPIFADDGRFLGYRGTAGDITAQREVEAEARERDRLFHQIVETTTEGIWVADADSRTSYVNERMAAMLGRPAREIVGRSFLEFLDGDALELWNRRKQGVAEQQEFLLRRPDGSEIWTLMSNSPILDEAGRFAGALSMAADITERKRADERVRKSEARFRYLFEKNPNPMWVYEDGSMRFLEVNDAAIALYGYSRDEFLSMTSLDIRSPEEAARLIEMIAVFPRTGFWHGGIWHHRAKDGRPIDVEVGSNDMVYEGRPAYIVAVRDVSEQQRTEAALRRSEAELRRAQKMARLGHWTWSAESPTDWANGESTYSPAAAEIFGVPPDALALSTTAFIDRFVHPEDRAAVAAAYRRLGTSGDKACSIEYRVFRADGEVRTVHEIAETVFDEAGRFLYTMGAVQDVTERKRTEAALRESEGRFRLIADSAPGILWLTDDEGRLTFLSKTFEKYTGQPGEPYYGRMTTGHAHPDDRIGPARAYTAAVEGRRPLSYEYRVRRHDGVYRWFLDTCIPRFDDEGRFLGYIGMSTDIEDQRALAEQLHQAQKMQAVGQLTGGIAHDFNNLLTVILGNAEMLTESLGDPKLQRLAAATQDAAERSAALVQRLLAFSRRQALQPMPIDVGELVRGMRDLMQRALGEDVDIRFSAAPGLWQATADRSQLEAALLNLAVNARDAMPGGGRLTIETTNAQIDAAYAAVEPEAMPGAYVTIAVSDTGSGMSEETRHHAFEPFFTTKEVGKGSGLGLSMVYGFIKQSGGHMTLYSELGHGTTIKMYLPRVDANAPQPAVTAPAEPSPATGNETILVVEDDERVRAYVVGQLGSLGYRVIEAANGPNALDVLERNPAVALLFTDVVMPGGMNGRQLADAACRLHPALRVLFTTGYTESAIVHHGRLDPGVDLLGKPFSRAALAAKIRLVLDRRG